MIGKEQVMERRQVLLAQRQQLFARLEALQAELEQVKSNINAHNGALEDCSFWLAQLDQEEENDG